MRRTKLDQGLHNLHAQVTQLGLHVENRLTETLKSLETGDQASLRQLIEGGSTIDALCTAAEQQTLRLLILQQPLAGQDKSSCPSLTTTHQKKDTQVYCDFTLILATALTHIVAVA